MLKLDRYIIVPTKSELIFFAKHKISDWGFETYKSYIIKQSGGRFSAANVMATRYNQCLNDIRVFVKDNEIKNYLETLVVKPINTKVEIEEAYL